VGQTLRAKVSDQFEVEITVDGVTHYDKPYSYLNRSTAPGWVVVKVTVKVLSGNLPFHGEYFELEERNGARHGPLNVTGPTPPETFEPLFPKTVSKAPDSGSGNLVFSQVGTGGYDISFPAVPDAYWSYDPPASASAEAPVRGEGTLRLGETMAVDSADVGGTPVVAFVAITAVRTVDTPLVAAGRQVRPGNGAWVAVDFIAGSDRGVARRVDFSLETSSGVRYAPTFWSLSAEPVEWPGPFDVPAGEMKRGTLVFDAPPGNYRVLAVTPSARAAWQY
jgi:hypothetical protein